jgi:hypothetical protein
LKTDYESDIPSWLTLPEARLLVIERCCENGQTFARMMFEHPYLPRMSEQTGYSDNDLSELKSALAKSTKLLEQWLEQGKIAGIKKRAGTTTPILDHELREYVSRNPMIYFTQFHLPAPDSNITPLIQVRTADLVKCIEEAKAIRGRSVNGAGVESVHRAVQILWPQGKLPGGLRADSRNEMINDQIEMLGLVRVSSKTIQRYFRSFRAKS